MQEQLLTQLRQLHLSPNEASVYLALLGIGQTSAGEIIKKTVLHRSVVYETLDKLIDKKLVFKLIKGKISYFQATNPEKLLENTQREQEIAEDLIPQLKGLIDQKLPEITIYEGMEAYRRFWLDSIKKMPEDSIDYVAGSIGAKWFEYMGRYANKYQQIRKEKRIKWKMIAFEEEQIESNLLRDNPELNEYRLIKRKVTKSGNYNIFNDDTLILHSAIEPLIIEIKNKSLVKVFQDNFNILWDLGEKIK